MVVAIDFTASNKPYTDPTSLHHLDPRGGLNDYEKVIESVGSVLAGYDTDNKVDFELGSFLQPYPKQRSKLQHSTTTVFSSWFRCPIGIARRADRALLQRQRNR